MNTRLILDASIIVKLIVREPGSTIAEQLFEDDRFSFATPSHALAEVTEVLCRKLRDGSIGDRQMREALIWLPVSFAILPLDELLDEAAHLAIDRRISAYDAFYVAAAIEHRLAFVTDDRKLAAKLAGTPVGERVVLLDDALRLLQIGKDQI